MVAIPLLLAALPLDVREQYIELGRVLKMDPTELVVITLRKRLADIRHDGSCAA